MKQESNGLTISKRKSNNGEDWYSAKFYYEVNDACERFWNNDQISHFVKGEPVRTGMPRKRPRSDFNNNYKRTKIHRKGS